MKKGIMALTVALLLVIGVVQVAAAAAEVGWGGCGPRVQDSDKWSGMVDKLNLTDQQIAKMRDIKENTYKQTCDLRIKLMDSKHELRQLQLNNKPDKAKIEAKMQEIKDLQERMHTIVQDGRQQCQSLLTQEQRDKIKQFKRNKGSGFKPGSGAGNAQ